MLVLLETTNKDDDGVSNLNILENIGDESSESMIRLKTPSFCELEGALVVQKSDWGNNLSNLSYNNKEYFSVLFSSSIIRLSILERTSARGETLWFPYLPS